MRTRIPFYLFLAAAAVLGPAPTAAAPASVPEHGVIGVKPEQLSAEFWIARLADPDRVLLDTATIDRRNANLVQVDGSLHDLSALPETLSREQIRSWIEGISARPTRPLYDLTGSEVPAATLDALMQDLALAKVADDTPARYGLVVRRAALRSFPTRLQVFSPRGDTDIDRFQETALFPGTPVVVAHESADGQWWFVVSPRYAAWVEKTAVALGSSEQVFGYAAKTPYRIVTGANVRTVVTPELPALSDLRLDMSARVPVLADWPAAKIVNGQHPYTSFVIELPLRTENGVLGFSPALVQRIADTAPAYLPLTRANIVRQAFKFLGERYGWGDANDGRDCSGFVSDVYRSMGVLMPRNTRDQAVSKGFDHRLFGAADDRTTRLAAVRDLDIGDLVYIPGHVMMAIGSIDGEPYVIHDTGGISYRGSDGAVTHVDLNEVAVSPLTPLLFNDTQLYVDRMTSIVRIRLEPERRDIDRLESAKDASRTP